MGSERHNTKYYRLNHQKIIEDYNRLKSIKEVSIIHSTSEGLISKVLINNDIELPKKIKLRDIDPTDVIKRYGEIHNTQTLAEEFNISVTSIRNILNKNGIKVSKIKYTDDEIIKKYLEVKTLVNVSNELKISDTYIRSVLKKHNVELQILKRKEIGDVFGKLTIIRELEPKITSGGHKRRNFILKCECGNEVKRNSLKLSEKSWHCGCVIIERKKLNEEKERIRKENYQKRLLEREEKKRNQIKKGYKRKYMVGSVKGKLTILSLGDQLWDKRTVLCKCECGNIKEMLMRNFYTVKSCGCLTNENRTKASTTHGMSTKYGKWYDRWKSMVTRCINPKSLRYSDYGGRGIKICDRWLEPNGVGCENYYNDIHNILGPQPSPNHSLDRINNDGMYEITNLRWATRSQQNKNKRYPKKKSRNLTF